MVGAGPVGLFGAYYAGFRNLSVAVVDSLAEIGGQVASLYPEKAIKDIAGFPEVDGADLTSRLRTQAATASPTYLLGETAERLMATQDGVTVTTSRRRRIHAGAVIVATGNGAFRPRPLPAARDYDGPLVTYSVSRRAELEGRDVMVVGGGDSAVDWALHVEDAARSVHLVHRRDRFRAHEATLTALAASTVQVRTPVEVDSLSAREDRLRVRLRDLSTEAITEITVDRVVAALGSVADPGPVRSWGLRMEGRYVRVGTDMRTNLPRVFAAGDVTDYPGKVRLIAVGFGEVATAVNNAATLIHPAEGVFPGHSTEGALPA